jgi:hypothetical protein
MLPASAGVQRFSTDMFRPRERITAWREFIGRKWFQVEIEPQSNEGFQAESAFRVLPGMSFISSRTKGARFNRAAHMIENDDLFLCVARAGTARYAACGREAVAEPGDAVLVGGGEPSMHVVSDEYHGTSCACRGPHWRVRCGSPRICSAAGFRRSIPRCA